MWQSLQRQTAYIFHLFSERPADAVKGTRSNTAGALQGDSQCGLSALQGGMTTEKEEREGRGSG